MGWTQNGNIRGASGVPGASGPPGATGPVGASGASGGTGATGGTGGPGTTKWSDITDKPGAILNYKGTWNASTNSPSLSDSTGSGGDVYRVSVAGSRNLGSGTISWEVGDYAIYSPVTSSWEKADTTDAVSSVAGRTGAVTLTSADLGASGSASSSTFLRGDNTWAVPSDTGITRSISTVTSNTTLGSTANTDYVLFCNISGDASFSSVKALLSGDGTNNSTTITDSSNLASNWTASGNAKLSTGTKKYGTASISTDGTSNTYVRASATASNFALAADFCIEFWVYFNALPTDLPIFDFRDSTYTSNPVIILTTTNKFGTVNPTIDGSTTVSTSTWYHVALTRSGSSVRLFVNGTQEGSTATSSTSFSGTQPTLAARYTNNFNSNAFWDDVRITVGTARYTSNFTAPTAAFVTSAATVTLPSAASNINQYTIRNIHSTDSVGVLTTSSQTIDGSASATINTGTVVRYLSDGSNWRTV